MSVRMLYCMSRYPLLCLLRLKNGLPLKDDYRVKQRIDALIIRGVTETDAGNYTMVLTNRITKEEHRRSFQLRVNGAFSLFFFLSEYLLESPDAAGQETVAITLDVFRSTVPPHIIEKEVAVDTDVYPYGSSPTLRCTARGFPISSHIQWQWMSKEDCPEVFM